VRLLIGAGTPRETATRVPACLFFVSTEAVAMILLAAFRGVCYPGRGRRRPPCLIETGLQQRAAEGG
jgi:hypothetical protein